MEFQVWEKRIVCVYWKRSQRNNKKRVGTFFLDNPFTPFSYKTRHCFSFSAVFYTETYCLLFSSSVVRQWREQIQPEGHIECSSIECKRIHTMPLTLCVYTLINRRHKFFFWNHWQIKPSKIVRKEFVKQKWRQNDKKVLHFQCSFFFVRAELAG